MAQGALVLVVGPSGAGKDTLIAAAAAALKSDARFNFPRRVVTRAAVAALEDHDSVEPQHFQVQKLRGAYALNWEAHGLSYGVPASIDATIAAGRVVVVNVSRQVISRALEKYPRCLVLLVMARPEIRAARLASRRRETEDAIAARLLREGEPVPEDVGAVLIDNSGALQAGVDAFVTALRGIAD